MNCYTTHTANRVVPMSLEAGIPHRGLGSGHQGGAMSDRKQRVTNPAEHLQEFCNCKAPDVLKIQNKDD